MSQYLSRVNVNIFIYFRYYWHLHSWTRCIGPYWGIAIICLQRQKH